MGRAPIVSVVIATFNSAQYVETALASVLGQTMPLIEVIVVDDCSSDETVAIVEEHMSRDDRVRVVQLDRNGGPATARNRGIELARGRWLAILDSDDLFAPDRLHALVSIAEREKIDIVADNLVVFSEGKAPRAAFFLDPATPSGPLDLLSYLEGTVLYNEEANFGYLKPVIRLDALRRADLQYDPALRIAEDDDLVARMLLAGMRYWLEPRPSYFYRRHDKSTSHRLSAVNANAMFSAAQKLSEIALSKCPKNVSAAFSRREAAMLRAANFAQLVDVLKARRLGAAMAIALRNPNTLPLLWMPIWAAMDRLRPNSIPPNLLGEDPDARAALQSVRQMQTSQA
jgi:succinoglycan biosynthesis protein ExoO